MINLPREDWGEPDHWGLIDPNNKIRQLRFCKGQLINAGYIGFTDDQLELLFKALSVCLGSDNVYKVEKYTDINQLTYLYNVKTSDQGLTLIDTN